MRLLSLVKFVPERMDLVTVVLLPRIIVPLIFRFHGGHVREIPCFQLRYSIGFVVDVAVSEESSYQYLNSVVRVADKIVFFPGRVFLEV